MGHVGWRGRNGGMRTPQTSSRSNQQRLTARSLLSRHYHLTGWQLSWPHGTDGETEARRSEGPGLTPASCLQETLPWGWGREQSLLTTETRQKGGQTSLLLSAAFGGAVRVGISQAAPASLLAQTSSWVGPEGGRAEQRCSRPESRRRSHLWVGEC